jgi:ArsR family transcriptional regulator
MNAAEKAKYETRAKVLKALAHPARLKLVDLLSEHDEVCVCELTEAIGTDMSTVSRHLTQLKNAGIVESEKHGQMVFYRLRVKCLTSLFGCIESVVHGHLKSQLKVLS